MNPRGLYAALALAVILGGGVWWSLREEEKTGKDSGAAAPGATKLLDLPTSQIARTEIKKLGAEPVVIERTAGDNWRIVAPATYLADREAANGVITALASLTADKTIDEKPKSLDEYGLGIPAIELVLTKKDGKTHRVLVGDQSSMSGGYFARIDNDTKVYSISTFTQGNLNKTLADLRDKRLLPLEAGQVTQLTLTAKGTTTEFSRSKEGLWQITKPQTYRADNLAVEEIVRKVSEAKQDATLAPEEAAKLAAAFAGGTPVATVSIAGKSLEVRKAKDDYLAKASGVEGAHKVTKELAEGLDKSLSNLRTNKLFDFGFAEVSKVTYREGATNLVYEHQADEWKMGSQKMSGVSVQSYIDKLRDLSSLRFLTDGLPAESVEVTVTSTRGLERVTFGKKGPQWLAQRPGEATVYEVENKLVEELQSAARAVKPEVAEKKK